MTIDLNALPIEADEVINSLKIRSNGLTLSALANFLENAKAVIDITIDNILEIFGAKDGKYKTDVVEKAARYSTLSTEDQAKYSPEDIAVFDEVLKYKKESLQKLIQSPFQIIKALIKDGIKDGQPVGLFDEFIDLLSIATNQNKSRLFLSDYDVWAEIFIRIIVKKQMDANKSFLLTKAVDTLIKNIPILNFMKKES